MVDMLLTEGELDLIFLVIKVQFGTRPIVLLAPRPPRVKVRPWSNG
jgi:hypothetical protein